MYASLTVWGLAFVAFFIGNSQTVAAADLPTQDTAQSTIEYRRIYVPANKVDAWPRDGEKYIPVESRDFDTWVAAANESSSARTGRASIKTAEYTARLESDGRLQGKGRWTIVLRGDKPAFLPLGNLPLILRNAHWQDSPQQPARLGIWGRNSHEADRYGLEVIRSGILRFSWHASTPSLHDQSGVPWHFPPANSNHLILDLPGDKQPRVDGGVVLESSSLPPHPKTPATLRKLWTIAIGPSPDASLRIVNTDRKTATTAADLALKENVSYQVGPRGLDIAATWQLEGPADHNRELTLSLPRGVQLTSIKADGLDLAWHMVRDGSSPSSSALIELPKVGEAKSLQIAVTAWQPLVLDAPWRLPRLSPDGVFWSSGQFKLTIAPEYELQSLQPTDCVETGVSPTNIGANSPEIHSLTAYTVAASLEISIAERQPDATIRAGSSLTLTDPDLKERLFTQWNLSRGSAHRLIGNLAAGWIVDAVETVPADAMGEWFVDRNGNERQIEIQLSHAATPARSVSVIIIGRLQRFTLADPISANTLRMVKWANARVAQHLLAFQSSERFVAEPTGDLAAVAPESEDENDRALRSNGRQ